MIKEYRFTPEGLKAVQKRQLMRIIPVVLLAGSIGVATSTFGRKASESGINVLPVVIPVVALVLGFSLFRNIRRQKKLLASYTVTLTKDAVMREQANTPPVCLYKTDVQQIEKGRSGLTLRGKDRFALLFVPAQIGQYAELEAALQEICPIATRSTLSFKQVVQSIVPFFAIGLFLCVYTATDKVVVGICGPLLTAILVWSLIVGQRSRQFDSRTKRRLLWIVVVIASVVCVTVMKLTETMPE